MKDLMDIFSLKDKTTAVTGGAGILGRSIAMGLGKAEARVAVCDIAETEDIIKDFSSTGIEAKGYYIDVLKKDKIQACHDQIFFDLKIDALEKVMALNLFEGAILSAQVFGKTIAENTEGGSIIDISSMNAVTPLARIPGYLAAKAAVSDFTQWLSVHFAQEYNKKPRVNVLASGFFLTQQDHFLLFDANEKLTERGTSIISHTPMARFGNPEDLNGVCMWQASDASKFVSGIVVPIDGSFSAFYGV